MKRVGIVICNYNKKDMVIDCIDHILKQTYTDYDLYVVDNASSDGSAGAIEKAYGERLTLLCNSENLGGSGGFNTGLRVAYEKGYPYLMCVDNDAMTDPEAVGGLVRFLDAHPECGMAASKIYHLEKPDYVQNFGQQIDYEYFCTEVDDEGRFEDGSMPDFVYTDGVPACSLMVRRETIDRIGFLPEENFLYWDDTEWCLLCNRAGLKVASVGASKAYHAMGAKKEDVNTFPTYYAWRNWITFFIKYTPEEKLVDMALTFLSSIFEVQYIGWYNDVFNKANTVMAAYDDALHQVVGKAPEGRIFDIDRPEEHYRTFFSDHKDIVIVKNGFDELTARIKGIAGAYGDDGTVMTVETLHEAEGKEGHILYLCRGFLHERYEEAKAYDAKHITLWDIDDCIVPLERQSELLGEFVRERELFIFSQLPLFLRQAEQMRGTL